MDKSLKIILLAGAGFGIYRLLKLSRLSNKLIISPAGAKIKIDKGSQKIILTITLSIVNPTQTNVVITNTSGSLVDTSKNTLGTFLTGKYTILPGENKLDIPIVIKGLGALALFTKAIALKKLPTVIIKYTNLIGALPVSDEIIFDLSKATNTGLSSHNPFDVC